MSLLGRFLNVEGSLLLFLPLAHVFARVIQVGAVKTRTVVGPHPGREEPASTTSASSGRRSSSPCRGCSRRSSTPPRARPRPTARARSSTGPPRWPSTGPGRRTRAAPASRSRPSTRCSTSWSTASCAPRSAASCLGAVSGGAPLGDRLGHFFRGIGVTGLRGLRPDRDHRGRHGQPRRRAARSAPSAGRCPASTSRSPTTARCCSAAASCARLLEERGRHRGGDRLRRLVPHRRPRRARRRRLPQDHRPQEGDPGDRGRQERRPRRARGPAARARAGQPVHGRRRPAAVHRAR